jgi:HlyD family secretion protein
MKNPEFARTSASIRHHLLVSTVASAALIFGIGGWAAATNLAGAVVATGRFVVDSYVKKVQHPTGGVVGEILVHEGQKVATGDVVMRLDATQTRANLAMVTKRLEELTVRRGRLEAERDDADRIIFSDEIVSRANEPEIAHLMAGERRLFELRRDARRGQKSQLRERVQQLEKEVRGLVAQQDARTRQIALIQKELDSVRKLWDKNLTTIQRIMSLEREAVNLEGDHGRLVATEAQTAGRIAETNLQIIQIDQDLRSEVAAQLRDMEAQIAEYVERKVTAEDQLKRIDILAPQDGIVHQLTVHTVGGVISPADPIMLIVPNKENLALDAHLAPQDIDQVHVGQKAILRLSAFNQRTTPELSGEVSRIAADLTEDQRTGNTYYIVRISLHAEELSRLGNLRLVAGMPAEAFIQTGERTTLSYLVKPLTDQMKRAFREE